MYILISRLRYRKAGKSKYSRKAHRLLHKKRLTAVRRIFGKKFVRKRLSKGIRIYGETDAKLRSVPIFA